MEVDWVGIEIVCWVDVVCWVEVDWEEVVCWVDVEVVCVEISLTSFLHSDLSTSAVSYQFILLSYIIAAWENGSILS